MRVSERDSVLECSCLLCVHKSCVPTADTPRGHKRLSYHVKRPLLWVVGQDLLQANIFGDSKRQFVKSGTRLLDCKRIHFIRGDCDSLEMAGMPKREQHQLCGLVLVASPTVRYSSGASRESGRMYLGLGISDGSFFFFFGLPDDT